MALNNQSRLYYRFTHAYAGKSRNVPRKPPRALIHPRLRGEKKKNRVFNASNCDSPTLTRGKGLVFMRALDMPNMPLFNLYNIPFFVLAYLICRKNKERDAFFEKNNKNKRKSLRCIIEILLFVIFFAFSFFCFFFSFFIRKSIIDNMTNLKNFCRFYDIFSEMFLH